MLRELIELVPKMKEKVKAMHTGIKGSNSEGEETGTQVNNLEQKEEINLQPEQTEETRIHKNEDRLRKLWDNFKRSSI